ncbi:MAG: hypothetical protein S4CHLAM102_11380 [Chlamydiia bacterium]|nr:hypothetical protein [Chlamydiia bacterium]
MPRVVVRADVDQTASRYRTLSAEGVLFIIERAPPLVFNEGEHPKEFFCQRMWGVGIELVVEDLPGKGYWIYFGVFAIEKSLVVFD